MDSSSLITQNEEHYLTSSTFESCDDLLKSVRAFYCAIGYGLSIRDSKKDDYVALQCDRSGAYRDANSVGEKRKRSTTSRLIKCPFHIVEDDIETVKNMTLSGIPPRQIISSLRQKNPNLPVNSRTIYNLKAKLRKNGLGNRSLVSKLFKELEKGGFSYDVFHDPTNGRITPIGFYVVVPDFFYGDPYVPEIPLSSWFRNHLPAKGAEDARKAVADLISKGASVVGVAGFCWGGMTVFDSFVVGPVRCLLYNLEGEFPVELIRLLSALSEGAWPAECVLCIEVKQYILVLSGASLEEQGEEMKEITQIKKRKRKQVDATVISYEEADEVNIVPDGIYEDDQGSRPKKQRKKSKKLDIQPTKKKRKGKKVELVEAKLVEDEMVKAEMVESDKDESESNEEPPLRKKKFDAPSFVDVRKLKGEVVAAGKQVSVKKGKQKINEGTLVSLKEGKKDKDEGEIMVVEKGKEVVLNEKVKCDPVNILTRMSPSHLKNVLDSLTTQQVSVLKELGLGEYHNNFNFTSTPGALGMWIVKNYDPEEHIIKIVDGRKIKVTRELIHEILGVPMGEIEVNALLNTTSEDLIHYSSTVSPTTVVERKVPTFKHWSIELLKKRQVEEQKNGEIGSMSREEELEQFKSKTIHDMKDCLNDNLSKIKAQLLDTNDKIKISLDENPEDILYKGNDVPKEAVKDNEVSKEKDDVPEKEKDVETMVNLVSKGVLAIYEDPFKDSQSPTSIFDSQSQDSQSETQDSQPGMEIGAGIQEENLEPVKNYETLEEVDFLSIGLEDIESLKGGGRILFDDKSTVQNCIDDYMNYKTLYEYALIIYHPQLHSWKLTHKKTKTFDYIKSKLVKKNDGMAECMKEKPIDELKGKSINFEGGHPTVKTQQIKKEMEGEKNVPKTCAKKTNADKQDIKKPQVRKQTAAQLAKSKETKLNNPSNIRMFRMTKSIIDLFSALGVDKAAGPGVSGLGSWGRDCETLEEADFPSTGLEDIESLKGEGRNLFNEKSTVQHVNEDDMILQDSLLNLPFLSTQEVACLEIDTQQSSQIQKQGIPKSFYSNKLKLGKYVSPDEQVTVEKRQEVMVTETPIFCGKETKTFDSIKSKLVKKNDGMAKCMKEKSIDKVKGKSVNFKGGHPTVKRHQIKKAMEAEKKVPKTRAKKTYADKQEIKKPQVRKQTAAQLSKSKETKAKTVKPTPTKRKKKEPNDKEEIAIHASPISFIPLPVDTESKKRQGKPSNFLVSLVYQRKVILHEPLKKERRLWNTFGITIHLKGGVSGYLFSTSIFQTSSSIFGSNIFFKSFHSTKSKSSTGLVDLYLALTNLYRSSKSSLLKLLSI
ncbi:protein FAR1-related sequence 5 [Tanacetum coccineum]